MERYYVWWPWLTYKRVAQVCQHQMSFLFLSGSGSVRLLAKSEFWFGFVLAGYGFFPISNRNYNVSFKIYHYQCAMQRRWQVPRQRRLRPSAVGPNSRAWISARAGVSKFVAVASPKRRNRTIDSHTRKQQWQCAHRNIMRNSEYTSTYTLSTGFGFFRISNRKCTANEGKERQQMKSE